VDYEHTLHVSFALIDAKDDQKMLQYDFASVLFRVVGRYDSFLSISSNQPSSGDSNEKTITKLEKKLPPTRIELVSLDDSRSCATIIFN
jgi:hypothetical protein